MNYNPADDPLAAPDGVAMLGAAAAAWTAVASSTFAFDTSVLTSRCPSLVKECRGRQVTDGFNDFAWMNLKDPNTLGVTWFSTSAPETDMALNLNFSWESDGINDVDAQTVIQHELGHVVGLGHSTVDGALMEPVYAGVNRTLSADDIAGVTFLYPSGTVPTGSVSGSVTETDGGAISGATVSTNTGQSTQTGADGSYTLGGVPAGSVTVTASASGFTDESADVDVTDGGSTTANFTLDPVAAGSTVSVTSISYSTSGGKGGTKNLRITIQLHDDQGNPVADASVSIDLDLDDTLWGSGTATTGTNGSVTFQARNAPSGHYETTIANVSAAGLTWDGNTPVNGFDK